MNSVDRTLLLDMLDAARHAREFVTGRTRAELDTNAMLSYALIRAIQVVGEAAGRVSAETKTALTSIPWHEIIGMRHRIVHDYGNVDHDIVWDVATYDLPPLILVLEKTLE